MKYRLVVYEDENIVSSLRSMFPFRMTDACDALKTGVLNKSKETKEVKVCYYKGNDLQYSINYNK